MITNYFNSVYPEYLYLIKYTNNPNILIGITKNIEETKNIFQLSGTIESKFFPIYKKGLNILVLIAVLLINKINNISTQTKTFTAKINPQILVNIINSLIGLSDQNIIPYFNKLNNKKKLKRCRKKIHHIIWNNICINLDKQFPNIMHQPMDIDEFENHYNSNYLDDFLDNNI